MYFLFDRSIGRSSQGKVDESSKDGDDETESAANNVLQAAAAFCRLHGFE